MTLFKHSKERGCLMHQDTWEIFMSKEI
jgi:hypothetical protein